jgi:hypothetical protein
MVQPTIEQLRLAILVAAQECNLDLVHELTVAYHNALGREDGERPATETPNSGQFRAGGGSASAID